MRIFGLAFLLVSGCSTLGDFRPAPDRVPMAVLERGWSYVEPAKEALALDAGVVPVSYSGPVLADQKIIFGSDRFGLVALSKKNGQQLWRNRYPYGVAAIPFVHDSRVYVGTGAGTVHQVNVNSGHELWQSSVGAPVHGTITFAFDRLFVATADEGLHCLDPSTGRVLWTYKRPAFGGTSITGGGHPSVIDGRIWMGFSDGALVSLDPQTGSVESERLFRDNLKFMDLDAKVIGWKDGLLVSTYDGKLRHLRRDGALNWEFGAGGARAPLLTQGDIVYFPSSDGSVYALSGSTGKEIWRYSLRRGVPTGMALVAGADGASRLVVSGSQEKIIVLNAATGAQLAETSLGKGSGSYAPIVTDDESRAFFVLSNYSRIYQFRLNL
jgi:outer membrane protein assembly factor BamB